MPLDLTPYLDPSTTAVIALEVQENLLLPESAMIPGVAAHATSIGLIPTLAGLFEAARRVGTQVVYVTDERRADGRGGADNLMVNRSITSDRPNPGHGPIVAELAPHPQDIWIKREHGMTGFFTTPLDVYLRNVAMVAPVATIIGYWARCNGVNGVRRGVGGSRLCGRRR